MLTSNENALHLQALKVSASSKRNDARLITTLIGVERSRYYRKLGRRRLVDYIIKDLEIDSTFTFSLARVACAATEFEELAAALEAGRLRVGHATRILGKLDKTNVVKMVEFASAHTFAEVVQFIAEMNPKVRTRETKKQISKDQTRRGIVTDKDLDNKLERVQAILAQKQKSAKVVDAIRAACELFLEKFDPVIKAERALSRPKRQAAKKITIRESSKIVRTRVPFRAAEKHEVYRRTGNRCTFQNHEGRCGQNRHTHIHHIVPVSQGGTNEPENLTVLCSFHHDFVHQLMIPGMPPHQYSFCED